MLDYDEQCQRLGICEVSPLDTSKQQMAREPTRNRNRQNRFSSGSGTRTEPFFRNGIQSKEPSLSVTTRLNHKINRFQQGAVGSSEFWTLTGNPARFRETLLWAAREPGETQLA